MRVSILAALALTCLTTSALAQDLAPHELARRTIERRAVEAVIWGTPAVNFDRMYQAMIHDAKAGEGSNKSSIGRACWTGRTRPSLRIPIPST